MERINSERNPLLKHVRKLLRSQRERRNEKKTLIDGAHLVAAYAERFGLEGTVILVSETGLRSAEIHSLVERSRGRIVELPDRILGKLSPVATPSGLIAVVTIPRLQPDPASTPFWLLLDGVQDPGNLGAILRTAAATGVTRAILSASCADVWSPKCLRGGMGAQFVLPITDHADLAAELAHFDGLTLATAPRAGRALFETALTGPLALVFGSEGAGLSQSLRDAAQATLHVPMNGKIESLNVAAAVAMVCYERLRQSSLRKRS